MGITRLCSIHDCVDPNTLMSVSTENIARIHPILHVVQTSIVAIGNDGMALTLEFGKVVDHAGTEESRAVSQRRFVY